MVMSDLQGRRWLGCSLGISLSGVGFLARPAFPHRSGRSTFGGVSPQIVRKTSGAYRLDPTLLLGIVPSQRLQPKVANGCHRSGSTLSSTTTCRPRGLTAFCRKTTVDRPYSGRSTAV